MSPQSDKHHGGGNFLAGLAFGVAAGAVGFFMLKTEDGKKARAKLMKAWDEAKEELVEQGVIKKSSQSLPKVIQHTIEKIVAQKPLKKIKHILPAEESAEVEAKKSKTAPKKKAEKKFKGTK